MEFVRVLIEYLVMFLLLIGVACLGIYTGYRIKNKREVYFKKQRKNIKKYGKLIAYMYRHYYAVNRKKWKFLKIKIREKDWIYKKCYVYAKKFEDEEINHAKAYLKSDLRVNEVFGFLIAISVGFGTKLINVFAYNFVFLMYGLNINTTLSNEQQQIFNNCVMETENFILIVLLLITIFILLKLKNVVIRQQYLLSILEDIPMK